MKRTAQIIIAICLVGIASAQDPSRVPYNDQQLFLSGGNVAWVNFARDIGPGTTDLEKFEGIFRALHDRGGNSMRLWLHTTGASTPAWSGNTVTGPGEDTIEDLRDILDLAWQHEIGLMLCLWSFDMLRISNGPGVTDRAYAILTDSSLTRAYIDAALVPMVDSLSGHPGILAWEIFNEPEGMSNEHGWDFNRHVPMSAIQRFINMTASAIHRTDPEALVTNGSWAFIASSDQSPGKTAQSGESAADLTAAELDRIRAELSIKYDHGFDVASASAFYNSLRSGTNYNYYRDDRLIDAGGFADGTLDFYTVHYYEWAGTALSPFHHSRSDWGLDKPLVIAEFFLGGGDDGNNDATFGVAWEDLYLTLFNRGYAGALGWQWYNHPVGAEGVVNWPRILTNTQRLYEERRSAVDVDPGLRIVYFVADPPEVERGDASQLSWSASGATSVTLDGAVVDAMGTLEVSPDDTTTWTLIAVDSVAADTVSAQVTVTVVEPGPEQPPTVTMSLPGDGAVVTPGFATVLGATATDADGSVEQVEYFVDGVSIGVATNSPWTIQWLAMESGEYQLTAVVTDDDGLTATSDTSIAYALVTTEFTRYEAEDAAIAGAITVANTAAASGGSYLDMRDTGTIGFDEVSVPANGVYWLVFGYNLNYDVPKHQDIIVNGDTLANLRFNGTQSTWRRRAVKVALNAGPNEIVISPIWGWMYFDYIDVSPDAVGTAVDPDASLTDLSDALDVNYPNPFRGETTIGYSIGARTHVTVEVFDVVGRRVATLVDAVLYAGSHTVTFDGSNLAGGVYYSRLTTEAGVVARQMVVLP